MGKIFYQFAISDYSTYTEDELIKCVQDIMSRLEVELSEPAAIFSRAKAITSLMLKFHFLIETIKEKSPGLIEEVTNELQFEGIMNKFNITQFSDEDQNN